MTQQCTDQPFRFPKKGSFIPISFIPPPTPEQATRTRASSKPAGYLCGIDAISLQSQVWEGVGTVLNINLLPTYPGGHPPSNIVGDDGNNASTVITA
jgi:hypothetical protein